MVSFYTQPDEIFYPKGKKLKNLEFLGEIFKSQTWLTRNDSGQRFSVPTLDSTYSADEKLAGCTKD